MKNRTIQNIFTALFLIYLFPVYSQNAGEASPNKYLIGAQFNPYIDQYLFDSTISRNVFAVRVGYLFTKNISAGPEFSGYCGRAPYTRLHQFNFGLFFRYSFFPDFFLSPFVEISPQYTHFYQFAESPTYHNKITDGFFNWYVAPGLSGYFLKKRLSFDLFYKFSSREFVNNKKHVITYRICIYF